MPLPVGALGSLLMVLQEVYGSRSKTEGFQVQSLLSSALSCVWDLHNS